MTLAQKKIKIDVKIMEMSENRMKMKKREWRVAGGARQLMAPNIVCMEAKPSDNNTELLVTHNSFYLMQILHYLLSPK